MEIGSYYQQVIKGITEIETLNNITEIKIKTQEIDHQANNRTKTHRLLNLEP